MDETTRQWASTGVFAVTIIAAMVVETVWLTRNQRTTSGKALGYVLLTDCLSMMISFGTVTLFMLILLMLVFGPDGLGTTGYDAAMWVVITLGIIFPPLIFVLIKRTFLYFFRISVGRSAWAYSVAATLLFLVLTPLPAAIVYYLLGYTR